MSGGSGKGGVSENKVEIPKELKSAATRNLKQAEQVARLPYTPNMGLQVAAFTPMQEAAFAGTNQAAQAFGLPYAGPNTGMGMPAPQNVGGFSGYSTESLYNNALAQVPPAVRQMYERFFTQPGNQSAAKRSSPVTAKSNAGSSSGKGGLMG